MPKYAEEILAAVTELQQHPTAEQVFMEMKKEHPCHKSKQWKIIRMGADIRIKCLGCGSSVLMPRVKFEKKLKRVVEHAPQSENAQEN